VAARFKIAQKWASVVIDMMGPGNFDLSIDPMITVINAIRAIEPSPTPEELTTVIAVVRGLKEEGTVGSTSQRILYEITKGNQKIPTFEVIHRFKC